MPVMRRMLPLRRARSRPITRRGLLSGVLLYWLAVQSVGAAADFWRSKTPESWSEKEVDQLLTNSPWARTVEIIAPDLSLAGRVGGLQGGRVGGFGGSGRPGAGGGAGGDGAGNLGGGSFLPSPARAKITVRWASAWPIREATARQRARAAEDESSTQAAGGIEQAGRAGESANAGDPGSAGRHDPAYRIAVVRIPLGIAVGSDDELRATASLVCRGGRVWRAIAVHFTYQEGLQTIEYAFSGETPLTAEDRDVEFRARVGDAPIKTTFRLDRMAIEGQPVL